MSATERLERTLLQQQILDAYANYRQAVRAVRLDAAEVAMGRVDELLERLPRQREAS